MFVCQHTPCPRGHAGRLRSSHFETRPRRLGHAHQVRRSCRSTAREHPVRGVNQRRDGRSDDGKMKRRTFSLLGLSQRGQRGPARSLWKPCEVNGEGRECSLRFVCRFLAVPPSRRGRHFSVIHSEVMVLD